MNAAAHAKLAKTLEAYKRASRKPTIFRIQNMDNATNKPVLEAYLEGKGEYYVKTLQEAANV